MVGVLAKYSKLTEGRVKERDLPPLLSEREEAFHHRHRATGRGKEPRRQQRKWAEGKDPEELTKVTQSDILEFQGI